VTPRSRTLSDGDIELPRIVMGEEVSLDRLYGDPNQRNCVLAGLSLSLRDDIQHSKFTLHYQDKGSHHTLDLVLYLIIPCIGKLLSHICLNMHFSVVKCAS